MGECPRILSTVTMKFLTLALLVAAVSARPEIELLAPPTELEYGFCDGSPEPATIDVLDVKPFPIVIDEGASITLEAQITLKELIAVGATVDLKLVKEGIIPITIPCVEIDGLHLGSCSFDADYLLTEFAPILCPEFFPDGQECALPLAPGVYGGGDPLVVGPFPKIPDIIKPFLKGTIRAEATLKDADGNLLACIWVRVALA